MFKSPSFHPQAGYKNWNPDKYISGRNEEGTEKH